MVLNCWSPRRFGRCIGAALCAEVASSGIVQRPAGTRGLVPKLARNSTVPPWSLLRKFLRLTCDFPGGSPSSRLYTSFAIIGVPSTVPCFPSLFFQGYPWQTPCTQRLYSSLGTARTLTVGITKVGLPWWLFCPDYPFITNYINILSVACYDWPRLTHCCLSLAIVMHHQEKSDKDNLSKINHPYPSKTIIAKHCSNHRVTVLVKPTVDNQSHCIHDQLCHHCINQVYHHTTEQQSFQAFLSTME